MRSGQWVGTVVAAAGVVLMLCSAKLSHVWLDRVVELAAGRHIQIDWYLLAGILVLVGGGLLAQFSRPSQPSGPSRPAF
jgi:hypothetical protein